MAGVKDRDAMLRVNFLYQAAHCVLAGNPDNSPLVRFYCHTQRSVCKRLVLRQDPSVKRTVCKRCSSLLVPGISAKVRQRRRSQRFTVVSCLHCGMSRRFQNRPDYLLWTERPEALLTAQKQSCVETASKTSGAASTGQS
ncbi:ribonuclease P protein subunit p21 [Mobula hypostoma]|uniref:ribonuclease P protein subunit p21 n=1 Tax=Mobula hypostoma TaxID=723540 RepID=UPI002FC2E108